MSRLLVVISLALLGVAGCSQGPTTYEVTGDVTYQGKPVPAGEVILEPDPAAGNTGTQARADIQNGKYRTSPGQGAVGGAMVVRVVGFDGVAVPESKRGLQIFELYQMKTTLPKSNTVLDINVPDKTK